MIDWVAPLYRSSLGLRAFCDRDFAKLGIRESWVPNILKVDKNVYLVGGQLVSNLVDRWFIRIVRLKPIKS